MQGERGVSLGALEEGCRAGVHRDTLPGGVRRTGLRLPGERHRRRGDDQGQPGARHHADLRGLRDGAYPAVRHGGAEREVRSQDRQRRRAFGGGLHGALGGERHLQGPGDGGPQGGGRVRAERQQDLHHQR